MRVRQKLWRSLKGENLPRTIWPSPKRAFCWIDVWNLSSMMLSFSTRSKPKKVISFLNLFFVWQFSVRGWKLVKDYYVAGHLIKCFWYSQIGKLFEKGNLSSSSWGLIKIFEFLQSGVMKSVILWIMLFTWKGTQNCLVLIGTTLLE